MIHHIRQHYVTMLIGRVCPSPYGPVGHGTKYRQAPSAGQSLSTVKHSLRLGGTRRSGHNESEPEHEGLVNPMFHRAFRLTAVVASMLSILIAGGAAVRPL